MCRMSQFPLTSVDETTSDNDYELAHTVFLPTANLTAANVSTIHVGVRDAGRTSVTPSELRKK